MKYSHTFQHTSGPCYSNKSPHRLQARHQPYLQVSLCGNCGINNFLIPYWSKDDEEFKDAKVNQLLNGWVIKDHCSE